MRQLGTKEANELRRLCHEGMLFGVAAWIRDGKSVATGGAPDRSPLAIAAGKGFSSLVKLLLEHEPSQDALDAAMAKAATGTGVETLGLLLAAGATLERVVVADVVSRGSPDVIEVLVRHGLDVGQDDALGWAMSNQCEPALEYFRKYHRRHASVRDQGAKALIDAVQNDNEYRAEQLKKAGADPRRRVVALDQGRHSQAYGTTALEAAALKASFKIFLLMGPRKSDDLPELMDLCCMDFNIAKIMMLIKRGAVVNDREDGGSSLIQQCLCTLGHGEYYGMPDERKRAQRAWELLNRLINEHGAKWTPSSEELREVRLWLRHASAGRIWSLAKLLVEQDVTSRESIWKLLNTPRFRGKLGSYWMDVRKLL
jgi:hypothetical protein